MTDWKTRAEQAEARAEAAEAAQLESENELATELAEERTLHQQTLERLRAAEAERDAAVEARDLVAEFRGVLRPETFDRWIATAEERGSLCFTVPELRVIKADLADAWRQAASGSLTEPVGMGGQSGTGGADPAEPSTRNEAVVQRTVQLVESGWGWRRDPDGDFYIGPQRATTDEFGEALVRILHRSQDRESAAQRERDEARRDRDNLRQAADNHLADLLKAEGERDELRAERDGLKSYLEGEAQELLNGADPRAVAERMLGSFNVGRDEEMRRAVLSPPSGKDRT